MAEQTDCQIRKYDIIVPGDKENSKFAFVLENVLTREECEELIQSTEKKGYETALVNVGGGRLRFLRYDAGQYFKPHYDGSYVRENGEISYITIHLYLNEGYEGGCTTFLHPKSNHESEDLPVKVKTGMVLIFEHRILHEGSILKKGRKYTMRTDVMYGP